LKASTLIWIQRDREVRDLSLDDGPGGYLIDDRELRSAAIDSWILVKGHRTIHKP